jgi:hypothetical protein
MAHTKFQFKLSRRRYMLVVKGGVRGARGSKRCVFFRIKISQSVFVALDAVVDVLRV